MKRITSILLLLLLVYNMMGYYLIAVIRQMDVKQEISRNKDSLSEKDLLVFKVPIPLYHQNDRDFESVEGRFEHNGRFYEMVRQKLKNDTLYVYCFNDQKTEKLYAGLSEHTQNHLIDFKGQREKNEIFIKAFIREYLPFTEINFTFLPFAHEQVFTPCPALSFDSVTPEVSSPPPRKS